jgi:hypothetical protein
LQASYTQLTFCFQSCPSFRVQSAQIVLAYAKAVALLGCLFLYRTQSGGQSRSIGSQFSEISEICGHTRNLLLPTKTLRRVFLDGTLKKCSHVFQLLDFLLCRRCCLLSHIALLPGLGSMVLRVIAKGLQHSNFLAPSPLSTLQSVLHLFYKSSFVLRLLVEHCLGAFCNSCRLLGRAPQLRVLITSLAKLLQGVTRARFCACDPTPQCIA